MSLTFDYKFGMFVIPKMFVLHSSKYFFTIAPPNPILKGRKKRLIIITINYRHSNLFKTRS
jgi:hypothetical protein